MGDPIAHLLGTWSEEINLASLPLRLLNTDPDAEQPEGRQRAQRCHDQK